MAKLYFFSILFIILYASIEVYAFQAFRTVAAAWSSWPRRITYLLYWSIIILGFVFWILRMTGNFDHMPKAMKTWGSGIFITALFCKLIIILFMLGDDAIRLTKWIPLKYNGSNTSISGASDAKISRSTFISTAAILTAGIPFYFSMKGIFIDALNFKLRTVKIPLKNLPKSFEGFKIAQISDIHSGSLNDLKKVKHGIDMLNGLKADVIFFTGDLVNDIATEVVEFKELFASLKAKHGVMSITGNHDYGDYVNWDSKEAKQQNLDDLIQHHKDMGWDILMNEHRFIEHEDGKLAIIGIENYGENLRFPKYGKMDKAYPGVENADVKLLLSHDPSHWDGQVRKEYPDIDVMFAGHTHGFQMGIENKYFKWSPSKFVYKQWAGLYQEGKQFLYVNRGFGFLGYPGRIGILPEVTLIELVQG